MSSTNEPPASVQVPPGSDLVPPLPEVLTRDDLERSIWRFTGFKGDALLVDRLMAVIDQYAEGPRAAGAARGRPSKEVVELRDEVQQAHRQALELLQERDTAHELAQEYKGERDRLRERLRTAEVSPAVPLLAQLAASGPFAGRGQVPPVASPRVTDLEERLGTASSQVAGLEAQVLLVSAEAAELLESRERDRAEIVGLAGTASRFVAAWTSARRRAAARTEERDALVDAVNALQALQAEGLVFLAEASAEVATLRAQLAMVNDALAEAGQRYDDRGDDLRETRETVRSVVAWVRSTTHLRAAVEVADLLGMQLLPDAVEQPGEPAEAVSVTVAPETRDGVTRTVVDLNIHVPVVFDLSALGIGPVALLEVGTPGLLLAATDDEGSAEGSAEGPLVIAEGRKRCKICAEVKPVAEFRTYPNGSSRTQCRPCEAQYQRDRAARKAAGGRG